MVLKAVNKMQNLPNLETNPIIYKYSAVLLKLHVLPQKLLVQRRARSQECSGIGINYGVVMEVLAEFLWRRSWGLADSSGVFLPGEGIAKTSPLLVKGCQLCNHGGGRDRAGWAVPEGLGWYHSRRAEEKGGGGRKAEGIGGNLHAASNPELNEKGTAHCEGMRGWRRELPKRMLRGSLLAIWASSSKAGWDKAQR